MKMGSAVLDTTPQSPADKIFPSKSQPGDDTNALLGGPGVNSIPGEDDSYDEMTPGKKLLIATAGIMNNINILESVTAGIVPPEVQQWAAGLAQQAPLMAEQMARQQFNNPATMMTAMGQSTPAAGNTPMGMAAMGMARSLPNQPGQLPTPPVQPSPNPMLGR